MARMSAHNMKIYGEIGSPCLQPLSTSEILIKTIINQFVHKRQYYTKKFYPFLELKNNIVCSITSTDKES